MFAHSTISVLAPAPDQNLTTLPALKREFDIQTDGDDIYYLRVIERVSASIADYCRRIFAVQQYQETFVMSGFWSRRRHNRARAELFLANRPVVPDTVVFTANAADLVEGTDYVVDYGAGIISFLPYSASIVGDFTVTYYAGYELPGWSPEIASGISVQPLPPSVEQAALMMIVGARQAGRLSFTDRDPYVRAETIEGAGSLSYGNTPIGADASGSVGGMSMAVKDKLEKYRALVGA